VSRAHRRVVLEKYDAGIGIGWTAWHTSKVGQRERSALLLGVERKPKPRLRYAVGVARCCQDGDLCSRCPVAAMLHVVQPFGPGSVCNRSLQ
jgi:hypothetical protein